MLDELGIKRKKIPLPFRLNHVNCFIAEGEKGYILIDTGLNNNQTKEIWDAFFSDKVLEKIYITHLHPDHYGYAGRLQEQTGAHLSISKIDADIAKYIWQEQPLHLLQEDYNRANVPEKITQGIVELTKNFVPFVAPLPTVHHYFQEGEKIQIGKELFEVIWTPGHSEGLVCFYNKEKSVLFSTDHILPNITPNISYWFYGEQNPLQSYEHSLEKMKQYDAQYVIPSHGDPFYNANERIEQIWNHHLERFAITLDALKKVGTVFEVCHYLFEKEFNVYEYQFAIGETVAHLEYLRAKGECYRELHNGTWQYYL